MADDVKVKMSEFAEATQVNNADDIIILQNGENKKVKSPVLESKIITRTVEELSKDGGVSLNLVNLKGVVATYANLPTTGLQVNDAYQVASDGLVYTWSGTAFQPNGQGFKIIPDFEVNGLVEQGNTNAVSGGEVYDYVEDELALKANQADLVQLESDVKQKSVIPNIVGYINGNGVVGGSGFLVTDFERYISGDIVVSGYQAASAYLLFFYDKYFQPISPYTTTTGIKTDITITQSEIPIGTAFVRSQSREQDNNGLLILKRDVSYYVPSNEEYIDSLLMKNELDGTTSTPTFNAEGLPLNVVHRDSSNRIVRTDTFSFSESQIVETRTLGGAIKTFTTDLSTLKTTIS